MLYDAPICGILNLASKSTRFCEWSHYRDWNFLGWYLKC